MKGQTNQAILSNKLHRKLRTSMTDAENRLWRQLRGKQIAGFKFRRQHPFGDYILDFVCLEAELVVEVDGGQHMQTTAEDAERDRRLEATGFRVLRFWNNQVLNEMEGVLETILAALRNPSPP